MNKNWFVMSYYTTSIQADGSLSTPSGSANGTCYATEEAANKAAEAAARLLGDKYFVVVYEAKTITRIKPTPIEIERVATR